MPRRQHVKERQQLDKGALQLLELHQYHLYTASAGEYLLALCHEAGVVGQGLQGIEPDLPALKSKITMKDCQDNEPEQPEGGYGR